MRPQKGFFFSVETSFRGGQSTVSMVFSRTLTERVHSSLNEGRRLTRIIKKFAWRQGFLIISLWWRITLLKQRGLCELSEIAKTLSIVYIKVFRLFICLYENTGAVDVELPRSRNSKKWKTSHWQGKNVSSEWRLFSEMNFVNYRSTYHFHVIE